MEIFGPFHEGSALQAGATLGPRCTDGNFNQFTLTNATPVEDAGRAISEPPRGECDNVSRGVSSCSTPRDRRQVRSDVSGHDLNSLRG